MMDDDQIGADVLFAFSMKMMIGLLLLALLVFFFLFHPSRQLRRRLVLSLWASSSLCRPIPVLEPDLDLAFREAQ